MQEYKKHKEYDVIPYPKGLKSVPLEFYEPAMSVRDAKSLGSNYPYVDLVAPEYAKRIERDVAQIEAQPNSGKVSPDSLYHAHMTAKDYPDPRRKLPNNARVVAEGRGGEIAERKPWTRRGLTYHTQEHVPIDPRKGRHNYQSWMDEDGIRPVGPEGHQEGIGGPGSEYPPEWGWAQPDPVLTSEGRKPNAQVHFRRKGQGYGGAWKHDYEVGTIPTFDGKGTRKAHRPNFPKPDGNGSYQGFDTEEEFLNTVNDKFPYRP